MSSSPPVPQYESKIISNSSSDHPMLQLTVPVSVTESIYESLIMLCAETIPQYNNSKLDILSLHPDYKSHLSTIQSIRLLLSISDQSHDLALLKLCFSIMQSQMKADRLDENRDHDFDSLFDILAMKSPAEEDNSSTSIVPILSLALTTLTNTDVEKLSTSDFLFLEKFNLVLENSLRDYHQFDSEIVSLVIKFYYNLTLWLYEKDDIKEAQLIQKLKQFQRDSITRYYKSFYPPAFTDEELKKQEDKVANKRMNLDDFFNSDEKEIYKNHQNHDKGYTINEKSSIANTHTLKPMTVWSATEWYNFSSGLCEAITIECRQFVPALSSLGLFDDCGDITVYEMIKLFNHDVSLCQYDRDRANKGMDDIGLSIIQALNRVRKHLLSYHPVFSVEGRIKILASFPDLNALCSVQLGRWLQNQHSKIQSLRERVINLDSWAAIDEQTPYSESVNDLYAIISTMMTGFFEHFKHILPYGVTEINKLIEMLYSAIIRYSRTILDSCGEALDLIPLENSDHKYKQSIDENDSSAISLVSAFKKKVTNKDTKSVGKALDNIINTNKRSLANQSLRSLAVKLSCLQAWKLKLKELHTELDNHWTLIIEEQESQYNKGKLFGISIEDWNRWADPNNKKQSLLPEKLKTNITLHINLGSLEPGKLFDSVIAELNKDITRISDLISIYIVYCDLRIHFLEDLYCPSCRAGQKIRSGPINERINLIMPSVYKSIQSELFPELVELLLHRLINCWRYVILFSRRIIEREDTGPILTDDYEWFIEIFNENMEEKKMMTALKPMRALLDTMELTTEVLIQKYESFDKTLTVSLDYVVRIIGLRTGKLVSKFMKKEREKQKQRQAEAEKIAKNGLLRNNSKSISNNNT